MLGYTSQVGYKHKQSKSIRGDQFCGLLCDNVNQEDLTEDRVKKWISQLKSEGFLEKGAVSGSKPVEVVVTPTPSVAKSTPVVKDELHVLEKQSDMFQSTLLSGESKVSRTPSLTFNPHYNAKTGVTMWVSTDGRKCFYTSGKP
jgi:flavodoxin I